MRKLAVLLLAAAVLAAAGCVSEDPAPADAATDGTAANNTVYQDDRIQIQTLDEAGAAEIEAPTLDAAPQWRLGEWWEIRLTDEFVGNEHRTLRVVAGQEKDDYLVGMPMHDFSNDIMVFHIPGFGQVDKQHLGYEIHDCPFQPLDFPLTPDKEWTTQFECRDVQATVTDIDGHKAQIEMIGNSDHITLTYDAEQRAITQFRKDGYGSYEIVDHGYAFHEDRPGMGGQVTVPHMHDVIFMHGRLAGAIWMDETMPTGLGPKEPTDIVPVDTSYDRVSFAIILGDVLNPGAPTGGYYKETATAPDGTTYELEMGPQETGFKMQAFKHDMPGGDWQFQHIAAGPGIALSEGIAYHVYDILLPNGTILPSIGEHQHGDPCAHGC